MDTQPINISYQTIFLEFQVHLFAINTDVNDCCFCNKTHIEINWIHKSVFLYVVDLVKSFLHNPVERHDNSVILLMIIFFS